METSPTQENKPERAGRKPTPGKQAAGSTHTDSRVDLVGAITSPLNFFALIVLVVEAIIGATGVVGRLSEPHLFDTILLMFVTLLALIGGVGFIAYTRPRNLSPEMAKALEQSEAALQTSKQVADFLSSRAFQDMIRDVLAQEQKFLPKIPPKGE